MPSLRSLPVLLVAGLLVACSLPGHERRLEARLVEEAESLAAGLHTRPGPPARAQEVRVRLAFGARADLDLYVTDPRQETVYYANTPSLSGGELARDLRCDAPLPRTEVITFALPVSGRYRVGVDFHERCDRSLDPVPFAVLVESDGQHSEQRGMIRFGQFLPIVLQFERK